MNKSVLFSIMLVFTTFAAFSQAHKFTVTKTDAEWKKELSPEAYEVTRKEGTERAYSESIGIIMRRAFTNVFVAGRNFSALQLNLRVAPAGPSFGNQLVKSMCWKKRTTVTICSAQKLVAAGAVRI